MRGKWVLTLGIALTGGIAWWAFQPPLLACGPFGIDATFVDIKKPDTTWEQALKGDLGILRSGLPLDHLVVAYRHLSGLPMVKEAWDSLDSETTENEVEPASLSQWLAARKQVQAVPLTGAIEANRSTATYVDYAHISDHAFGMAIATLNERIKCFGANDPHVLEWVRGQDQVFSSRIEKPEMPEPVYTPDWLRLDRNYQRAAALFYGNQWEQARTAFAAIAKDTHSPWRAWGAYLQARCWLRQADLGPEAESPACLSQAQRHLESIVKDPTLEAVHRPSRSYLEFVRYRREPQTLQMEALTILSKVDLKPGEGTSALVMLRETQKRISGNSFVQKQAPNHAGTILGEWLNVMQGRPIENAQIHAYWEKGPTLPWMIAGLARLKHNDPLLPEIQAKASLVSSSGPAAPTLQWHLLCRTIDQAAPEERLPLIRSALKKSWPRWAENQLLKSGREHSLNLANWAEFLGARVVAIKGIEWEEPSGIQDPKLPEETARHYGNNPLLMDDNLSLQLNHWVPLDRCVELSECPGVPRRLREDLAHVAWVRAVLLERWDTEQRLRKGLDPVFEKTLDPDFSQFNPTARNFRLSVVFMRNPGLSPLLSGGMGRGIYGWEPLAQVVDFGTNWWCLYRKTPPTIPPPTFLSPRDLEASRAEWTLLEKIPSARHWLGKAVLAQAASKAEDPDLPYALHRFVRMTRNADCYDKDLSDLGKRCFQILHNRYPKSPWTLKTPVHY